MPTAEQLARQSIDRLLSAAGWAVQDFKAADIHAARGVALREFELNPGHGTADCLLYVDGKAASIIEAKRKGATRTGVEVRSASNAQGLPATLPAQRRPLPFLYESTGLETHFTSALEPPTPAPETSSPSTPPRRWPTGQALAWGAVSSPRKRESSVFHHSSRRKPPPPTNSAPSFLHRERNMPPLVTGLERRGLVAFMDEKVEYTFPASDG